MIKVQGHRGFSELYPENTLLAFQKCFETGVDGIETDIRKTSDGQYVLIHDATVDRTTNGTGEVSSLNWSYISGLDAGAWKHIDFADRADCRVMLLSEFLETFKNLDIILILQIYTTAQTDAENIVNIVASKGMTDQVMITGSMTNINWVKAYNPNIYTMNAEMPTISNYQSYLDNAVTNNHDAVSVNAGVSEDDLAVMAAAIKAAGKEVHASYLSSSYSVLMQRHINEGTDMILGNNPGAMQSFVDNYYGLSKDFIRSKTVIKTSDGEVLTHPYIKTPEGILKLTPFDVKNTQIH